MVQTLALYDVHVHIGRQPILQAIDLRLGPGEWYGLVGPNGSGKTTVMRAALGLVRPSRGRVSLFSAPPPGRPGLVGVSFGARLIHPRRRARTELWLRIAALGGDRDDLDQAWAQTGLIDTSLRCGDLSLGQAQRLSIVAALLGRPALVVLDEPTVGLDAGAVQWLRERLRGVVHRGGCVWISSHDLSEVERCADVVTVMESGRVIFDGPMAALLGEEGPSVRLRSSEPALLRAVLTEATVGFRDQPDGGVILSDVEPESVGRLLADRRVPLVEMGLVDRGLSVSLARLLAPVEVSA